MNKTIFNPRNLLNFLHENLLTIIFEKLDFELQTNLCAMHPKRNQSCHFCYVNLKVTNLNNMKIIFKFNI